jgi:hypothetical protein
MVDTVACQSQEPCTVHSQYFQHAMIIELSLVFKSISEGAYHFDMVGESFTECARDIVKGKRITIE